MELLADDDPKIRRFAVRGIHDVWPHAFLLSPEIRNALRDRIEQAASDHDDFVRLSAKDICGQFGYLDVDETQRLNQLEELKRSAEIPH
jgi:hypothetical protein